MEFINLDIEHYLLIISCLLAIIALELAAKKK